MSWLKATSVVALPFCLLAVADATDQPCSRAVPEIVTFDSGQGAVDFPHHLHIEMEVSCEDCHHETRAGDLEMPHPEYFEDFWIRCETCHRVVAEPGCPQGCSVCHHDSPVTIADETLSSKVVIHQACWECHPAATGADASRSCGLCHKQGARSDSQ